jgi:predicted RNase H-like HicB family nuclease
MSAFQLDIIVKPCEEGGYFASCPSLQGCHAEGETYADAIANVLDVARIIIEYQQQRQGVLPSCIELPEGQPFQFNILMPA